jgi:hypothetical protein
VKWFRALIAFLSPRVPAQVEESAQVVRRSKELCEQARQMQRQILERMEA